MWNIKTTSREIFVYLDGFYNRISFTILFAQALEPSVAQGTHITPAVYPRLVVNYDFSYFSL